MSNMKIMRSGNYGRIARPTKVKRVMIQGWVRVEAAALMREQVTAMNTDEYAVTFGDFLESAIRTEVARLNDNAPARERPAYRVTHPKLNLGGEQNGDS